MHTAFDPTQYRVFSQLWSLCAALLLIAVATPSMASVELPGPRYHLQITQNTQYFYDTDNLYQVQDFLNEDLLHQFTPARTSVLQMGYTDATLWLRLQIINPNKQGRPSLLFVNQPNIGKLSAFKILPGEIIPVESAGNMQPKVHGIVRHKAPVLRLMLDPDTSNEFLIAVESPQQLVFALNLADPASFYQLQFEEQLITGLGFGITLAMFIFGLVSFSLNRNINYMNFAGSALLISFYGMTSLGYIGYYWLSVPGLQLRLENFSLIMVCVALLQSSRILFELPLHHQRLDSLFRILMLLCLLSAAASLGFQANSSTKLANLMAMLSLPIVCYASLVRAINGSLPARIMVPSRLLFIVVSVIIAQSLVGVLISTSETQWWLLSTLLLDCLASLVALSWDQKIRNKAQVDERQTAAIAVAKKRAKGEFLSQISHEIRTPMNGILGMAELLEDSKLSHTQLDYVRTINASGNNLLKILDDILDFSKIETGKMTLDMTSFDIVSMLSECIEMFKHRAEEKDLELITHVQNDVPTQVKGDPSRTRQILANLVSNAIKYTDRGDVVITISKDPQRGIHHLLFEVKDTGIGVSKDQLEQLINCDSLPSNHIDNHGLGIPISQQLIRMMGGKFGAESQLNKGSTFWFSIPLEPDPDGQNSPLIAEQLHGLRLLIVDDNASCRLVIQQQASSWGMTVSTAVNGRQALAFIHNQTTINEPYDVVILDHEMPGMNGMELAVRMKEDAIINNEPLVLMLTGLGMAPSATAARNAGIRRVISKPVTGRHLRATLLEELAHLRRIVNSHDAQPTEQGNLANKRVLVAEDHHLSQKVVKGMLKRLGMESVTVETGLAALKKVKEEHFDLILMDCEMPEMNGFDATRAIRLWEQENQRNETPIIALTAHIMDEHKERSMECGMNAHLAKPVEMSELRDLVLRWTRHPAASNEGHRVIP